METNTQHLTQRQQLSLLGLVVVIGIGGTALGALSVRSNIFLPFQYQGNNEGFASSLQVGQDMFNQVDTDGDGLFDNDEVSSFGTSPYLDDSDSDGVNDGDELKNGTDPNCPLGQECVEQQFATSENTTDSSQENTLPSGAGFELGVAKLREMLIEGGMSPEEVAALKDEEILMAYQQVSSKLQVNQTDNNDINELKKLSASEIRTLMIERGIDASTLEAVSDEELVELYQQSFSSVE